MVKLNSKDTYQVIKDDYRDDDYSLFSLYLPIVGYRSIALYKLLISESYKRVIVENHDRLCILLNISIDDLYEARLRLEEVMLLKTFNKENKYLYQIISPLSANVFLTNEFLTNELLKAIGVEQYEITATKFLSDKISTIDYKDITSKFVDGISNKFDNEVVFSQIKPIFDFKDINNEDIDFNYEYFIRNTSDLVFPIEARNETNLRLIGKLATLYGISEDTMSILVGRCSSYENGTLDISKLKVLARRQKPEKTEHEDPYMLSPVAFLQNKQNGIPVTSVDAKLLNYLSLQLNLKHEVINVLIEYVLDINQNKLPKNYVEKIAGEWVRENIDSKEKAIKKTKQTSFSQPKTLVLPEYYSNEIVEDSDLDIDDEKVQELKDRLKRI
ncbi:MAG TPA: hypothetical protein DHS57_06710 [Erysipelotrichaceae bacterium]|jgi:replication initiation and membrane attachment protein|nr:DnaD domain protein [Bacillota bacterium]NLP21824.1 hypothetical protein [Erysipelotrichaceae bacterium]HCY06940.1 hypothetical protein [Erysipelotrichaceae bacterium]